MRGAELMREPNGYPPSGPRRSLPRVRRTYTGNTNSISLRGGSCHVGTPYQRSQRKSQPNNNDVCKKRSLNEVTMSEINNVEVPTRSTVTVVTQSRGH